jgi:hypothetical protein
MLGKLVRLIRPATSTAKQHPLLPRILAAVGNDIAEVPNFAEQLIPAAEEALAYFSQQISSIPGPIELSVKNLESIPQLARMIAEEADIDRAFGRSLAVKEALPHLLSAGHDEVHALLGMRQKAGNGPEATPIFADHTLRSLAGDADDTREMLRLAAFDRLLLDFAEHVGKLRRKDRMLKIEWEWNLQHDAARVMAGEPQPEYVYAARELTPENQLHGLLTWLSTPKCFFQLQAPAGDNPATPGELPLLHCSDRRQWQVSLVRFSAKEAAAALQRETHNHRYILI